MPFASARHVRSSRRRSSVSVAQAFFEQMQLLRKEGVRTFKSEAPRHHRGSDTKQRLRSSIKAGSWETNGSVWRLVFKASFIIRFVVKGTRAHSIGPRPKQAMAFPGGEGGAPKLRGRVAGSTVFVRGQVQHPGMKGSDFVERAKDRWLRTETPRLGEKLGEAMLDELAGEVAKA